MDERYNRIVRNEEFNRLLDEIEALEADRIYCRHGLEHLLDVARISYIQVLEDGLDYDKNILYAAALLHDIGRAAEYRDAGSHDEAGAVIAAGILRDCGYAESGTRRRKGLGTGCPAPSFGQSLPNVFSMQGRRYVQMES